MVRGAAVDYDRQLGCLRQLQLLQKNMLLHVPRRMVIEIVQPNLAPGNDLGVLCQLRHLLEIGIAGKLGFVRMNPDGRINELMLFGELDAAVERTWARPAADGENGLNTRILGPLQHKGAVSIELLHLEMCVGIDEHGIIKMLVWGRAARPSGPRENSAGSPWTAPTEAYFNLVPTGTSSRKPASTAFPPSGDAATIIPFDSSPRSFLGARLATITTFLPINSSGAYDSAIPATTCRTSVPRSTSRRSNLSAPFTFSATFTWPTRSSTLAKSSMLILPSGTIAAVLGAGALAGGTGSTVFSFSSTTAGTLRSCSSICCILSMVFLSARGKTGCRSPSLVPSPSCPNFKSESENFRISPS